MAVRNRVGDILLRAGVLDALQLRSALALHSQFGGSLSRIVVERSMATEDSVTHALARGLQIERAALDTLAQADAEALAKVDAALAQKLCIFPVALRESGKVLVLAMEDPTNLAIIDQIAAIARVRVVPQIAGEGEIDRAIRRHYFGESAPRPEEVDAPGRAAREAPPVLLAQVEAQAPSLSADQLKRLALLRDNQEKSGRILRALVELLEEKGALGRRELAARRPGGP